MADAPTSPTSADSQAGGFNLASLFRRALSGDILMGVGVLLLLVMLLLPMPRALLDLALAISISFSVLILMTALFVEGLSSTTSTWSAIAILQR